MPDILIRGLSEEAVAAAESAAAELGLSRNEYLRRRLEVQSVGDAGETVSLDDLRRASAAVAGLLDPDTMDGGAWR